MRCSTTSRARAGASTPCRSWTGARRYGVASLPPCHGGHGRKASATAIHGQRHCEAGPCRATLSSDRLPPIWSTASLQKEAEARVSKGSSLGERGTTRTSRRCVLLYGGNAAAAVANLEVHGCGAGIDACGDVDDAASAVPDGVANRLARTRRSAPSAATAGTASKRRRRSSTGLAREGSVLGHDLVDEPDHDRFDGDRHLAFLDLRDLEEFWMRRIISRQEWSICCR